MPETEYFKHAAYNYLSSPTEYNIMIKCKVILTGHVCIAKRTLHVTIRVLLTQTQLQHLFNFSNSLKVMKALFANICLRVHF